MYRDMQRQHRAIEAIIRDEFISKAAKDFIEIIQDILTAFPTALSGNWQGSSSQAGIKTGQKIFDLLSDAKKYNEIIYVYKEYAKKYLQRHGVVKVLGMEKPEQLKSVYTFVELLNARYIRRFESVESLEQQQQGLKKSTKIKDIEEKAVHRYRHLMVLGEPGAGKTTFLRKRGLEALQGKEWGLEENSKQQCLPVFIELKRLASDEKININNLIKKELSIFKFDWAADFFADGALKKGKLLVLLDGLDEVPTEKMNEVVEKIQDFVDLYDKNRFIISCRTGAYRYNFYRFNDVLISYFQANKRNDFIVNWFTQKNKLQTLTKFFTEDTVENKMESMINL